MWSLHSCVTRHHLSLRALVPKPLPLVNLRAFSSFITTWSCWSLRKPWMSWSYPSYSCSASLDGSSLKEWSVSFVQFIKDLPSFISCTELPTTWPLFSQSSLQLNRAGDFQLKGNGKDRRQKEGELNVCLLHCSSPDQMDISGFIITIFLWSENLRAYELEGGLRE